MKFRLDFVKGFMQRLNQPKQLEI